MSPRPEPPAYALMVKTAKGSAEITTREHRLGPRLRTMLIMVDGKLTWAEISARAAALGNAPAIVSHLLNEGFIEPAGAWINPRNPTPAPAPDQGARTVRLPTLAASGALDDTTRNMITELTRSGNLVTLRGDTLGSLRENDAINPARFFMRETMSKLLGGGAVGVLDSIDLATTHDKLIAELEPCVQIIRDLRGEDEATGFRVSVLALLPE